MEERKNNNLDRYYIEEILLNSFKRDRIRSTNILNQIKKEMEQAEKEEEERLHPRPTQTAEEQAQFCERMSMPKKLQKIASTLTLPPET